MSSSDKRTSPDQLIKANAIDEMLSNEPYRKIPEGKSYTQFIDDTIIIKWINELGLPTTTFDSVFEPKKYLTQCDDLKPRLVKKTLEEFSELDACPKVLCEVNEYLQTENLPNISKILVVHGSKDLCRVELGVELIKKGFAERLLVTGRSANYDIETKEIEAELFKKHAIRLGLSSDLIITESNSVNLPDNVKRCLILLEDLKIDYSSLICVISWFACRRALSLWQLFTPLQTRVSAVSPNNVAIGDKLSKENWWRNEFGINVIYSEFVKMGFTKRYNI